MQVNEMTSGLNVTEQTGTGVLDVICMVPLKMNGPLVNSVEPHVHYLLFFVGEVNLTVAFHIRIFFFALSSRRNNIHTELKSILVEVVKRS